MCYFFLTCFFPHVLCVPHFFLHGVPLLGTYLCLADVFSNLSLIIAKDDFLVHCHIHALILPTFSHVYHVFQIVSNLLQMYLQLLRFPHFSACVPFCPIITSHIFIIDIQFSTAMLWWFNETREKQWEFHQEIADFMQTSSSQAGVLFVIQHLHI